MAEAPADQRPVKIFFVNGILAEKSVDFSLQLAFQIEYQTLLAIEHHYNQTLPKDLVADVKNKAMSAWNDASTVTKIFMAVGGAVVVGGTVVQAGAATVIKALAAYFLERAKAEAELLLPKVRRALTEHSKVVIIAHSHGGMVVNQLFSQLQPEEAALEVVIFGCPQKLDSQRPKDTVFQYVCNQDIVAKELGAAFGSQGNVAGVTYFDNTKEPQYPIEHHYVTTYIDYWLSQERKIVSLVLKFTLMVLQEAGKRAPEADAKPGPSNA